MSSSKNIAAGIFMALSLAIQVRAQEAEDAWEFPDFSATQTIHTAKYDLSMKVYRSGSTVRLDRSAAIATLYVSASTNVYQLTGYPDGSHQCVSMTSKQAKGIPSPLELLFGTNVKKTSAGTELVEGHQCKVEVATVTRPDGNIIESKVWEAEDLKGVPVKIETHFPNHLMTAVYSNIVLGTPDKALITPPAKCTPYEKMWQVAK